MSGGDTDTRRKYLLEVGWTTMRQAFADPRDATLAEKIASRMPGARAHVYEDLSSPARIRLIRQEMRTASQRVIQAAARAQAEHLEAEGQREKSDGILDALARVSRLSK